MRGGGNAVRAVACLPALVGAWRDPAGGALLSSSGTFPVDTAALERPDLIRGTPRTINMSTIGDALLDCDRSADSRASTSTTRIRSPWRRTRARSSPGFAREDLFCVVHDIFRTDTADYADILLPATTQLEQLDVHASYGHLTRWPTTRRSRRSAKPLPNTEVFRRLAARMGFDEACFRDSDESIARECLRREPIRAMAGIDWETLKARRLAAA